MTLCAGLVCDDQRVISSEIREEAAGSGGPLVRRALSWEFRGGGATRCCEPWRHPVAASAGPLLQSRLTKLSVSRGARSDLPSGDVARVVALLRSTAEAPRRAQQSRSSERLRARYIDEWHRNARVPIGGRSVRYEGPRRAAPSSAFTYSLRRSSVRPTL